MNVLRTISLIMEIALILFMMEILLTGEGYSVYTFWLIALIEVDGERS